jgi:hypothetical protein
LQPAAADACLCDWVCRLQGTFQSILWPEQVLSRQMQIQSILEYFVGNELQANMMNRAETRTSSRWRTFG